MDTHPALGQEHAEAWDAKDSLKYLRREFIIPSKEDLRRKTLASSQRPENAEPCVYLCGNSLGLQPRCMSETIQSHLQAWANKGVYGHFESVQNPPLEPWLDIDAAAARAMSPIAGAKPSEIAVMGTLTANLHLLLASFYRPEGKRCKILLEGKAFPSDHFAVESHIQHRGLDPKDAMVLIQRGNQYDPCLPIDVVLKAIDEHAETTSVILLPGVQYYTGQLFPIKEITAYAHEKGLVIGWDLAHAIGNVELSLHDWNVDFAVWCSYKYLNAGPGAIAGLFVHERHGQVNMSAPTGEEKFRHRLSGWWGVVKGSRFEMENNFVPIEGAAGFQLSNPSALDLAALQASLSVFHKTDMSRLRNKSVGLTGYLVSLLNLVSLGISVTATPWTILTPVDHQQRGAQVSIKLHHGYLDAVAAELKSSGIVVDERKPDVIRVAPAPLYNTYMDVWIFVNTFVGIVETLQEKKWSKGD